MDLTNQELERAAVAAENWKKNTNSPCISLFVSNNYGWPAVQALEFRGDNAAASRNVEVCQAVYALNDIYDGYAYYIDVGDGDKVATAFRKEKK